ncbi:MAG: alpha-xenorhabdolysin family binary toxin subunit A [Burkholderiaceae bacterium]|nr:alpha-xenorhabdolysin family binary toxin subunit A [Burkholderiaceae bacterium]
MSIVPGSAGTAAKSLSAGTVANSLSDGSTPKSIGPGALATPAVKGGPAFAMSATEWLAIQTYVVNALALPTTDAAFKASLGAGAPDSMTEFAPLISAYGVINGHCATWQNTVFPATVSLAAEVSQYGRTKAPTYYGAILAEADILSDDPTNAKALKALKAILDNLSAQASTYADRASAVADQIATFATNTRNDQVVLIGSNGDAGLYKTYNDKYGAASDDVKALMKDIAAQQLILDSANEEYKQDVIIASTSPTYAWVFPFGTIAAAVVAGVYGARAVEALDRAKAASDKIKADNAQLAADAALMIGIHMAQKGMNEIIQALAGALPIIQKIQGIWGGLASDLKAIVTLIDTDIRQALPIIMDLGVDEAIQAWKDVAAEADNYRVNAYVTVSGAPAGTTLQ